MRASFRGFFRIFAIAEDVGLKVDRVALTYLASAAGSLHRIVTFVCTCTYSMSTVYMARIQPALHNPNASVSVALRFQKLCIGSMA